MNRPLVLLSIVIALSPAWTMAREWKDNTGKLSLEAELVRATPRLCAEPPVARSSCRGDDCRSQGIEDIHG